MGDPQDKTGRRRIRVGLPFGINALGAALLAGNLLVIVALTLVTWLSSAEPAIKAAVSGSFVAALTTVFVALYASEGQGRLAAQAYERQLQLQRADSDNRQAMQREEFAKQAERRRQDSMLQALQYFGGRSQVRSIGISIVDGSWDEMPEFRGVFVPLLINQAIYLLSESEAKDAEHELFNLRRIRYLLGKPAPDGHDPRQDEFYEYLLSVIDRKKRGEITSGLQLERAEIDEWITTLESNIGQR
jgi:hypothetical protein